MEDKREQIESGELVTSLDVADEYGLDNKYLFIQRVIMQLLIKRYKGGAYNETDIICDANGQEILRRQNLAVRVKYGTKKVMFKGNLCNVSWERVSSVS